VHGKRFIRQSETFRSHAGFWFWCRVLALWGAVKCSNPKARLVSSRSKQPGLVEQSVDWTTALELQRHSRDLPSLNRLLSQRTDVESRASHQLAGKSSFYTDEFPNSCAESFLGWKQ
jgi:hypothetical protein